MQPRRWILLIFAIVSAVGSLAASHATLPWLESIGSNLAAGFLGSFLTVLLIDSAIAKERDRENQRVRALALGQLRPFTLQQLDLLCAWFRAAVERPPEKEPANIREFFSDPYYREVCLLDFSKPAPTSPPMPWFQWSGTVIKEFRAAVYRVLDKYALLLDDGWPIQAFFWLEWGSCGRVAHSKFCVLCEIQGGMLEAGPQPATACVEGGIESKWDGTKTRTSGGELCPAVELPHSSRTQA